VKGHVYLYVPLGAGGDVALGQQGVQCNQQVLVDALVSHGVGRQGGRGDRRQAPDGIDGRDGSHREIRFVLAW